MRWQPPKGPSPARRPGSCTPTIRTIPACSGLLDRAARWGEHAESSGRSCADCHGDAVARMRGVATCYLVFDPQAGEPSSLEGRIQRCRVDHQGAPPLPPEGPERRGMLAFVTRQSRGLPIAPATDKRLRPALARGQALFERRQGQIDLSCADCHDRNAGRQLGGAAIPAAHLTGYPIYRLEWQGLGVPAAAPAQLHDRHARRALSLRHTGAGRARVLPDDLGPWTADGNPWRAALSVENNACDRLRG